MKTMRFLRRRMRNRSLCTLPFSGLCEHSNVGMGQAGHAEHVGGLNCLNQELV